MSFQRNAKLGLAGRYTLVCAIEEGMTLSRPRPAQRVAGDRASLVAPLAGSDR